MSKISTVFNNFSRGKLDHDIGSRYDLDIYRNGADIFKNFFSNYKGNAIYRGGFENIFKFQDCAFVRFRFNSTQDYILCLYNTKMKILTYDGSGNVGFVQSVGGDLEVTTPWNLAQSKELAMRGTAQAGDIMYMCHPSFAPYKLTRVSASSFTLATFTRTADPFTGANAYPTCCGFHDGALYYGNTNNKKTTLWRSKVGDYEDMTTGTGDDDGFEVQIAELTEHIVWIRSGVNSLIVGSTQAIIPVNGGGVNEAITPTNVTTKISDSEGTDETVPVQKENLLFYINQSQRRVNYFNYDIIQETFQSQDANLAAYDITEGGISKLVYKKDRHNLIWSVRGSEDLVSLNFSQTENVMGWHEHESEADFKDVMVMNDDSGNAKLFTLMKYGSDYFICRMFDQLELPTFDSFYGLGDDKDEDTEIYNRYIAERMKEMCYLDISSKVSNYYTTTITYVGDTEVGDTGTITSTGTEFSAGDVGNRIYYKTATGAEYGIFEITSYTANNEVDVEVLYTPTATSYASWYKSFSTVSGLTDFEGVELSVVGDGGYIGEFTVDSGAIDLVEEFTVAWVGFKYEGLIKTFNLGLVLNGLDTHYTPKSLSRSYLRCVQSAGLEIGSSLYRMKEVQEFSPLGYLDLPPLPIDGVSNPIPYTDSNDKEKAIYIRQNKPLRAHITALMAEVDHVMNH